MRLGGPIFADYETPDEWARAVRAAGYSAAVAQLPLDAPDQTLDAYRNAAQRHDIVIAEVGAWGANPLHRDDAERRRGLETIKTRLQQADRLGARCCVNIAGTTFVRKQGEPVPNQLTDEVFALIVDSVREIIDEVRPTRTFYALETMPWLLPNTADSYVSLLNAIDRGRFAVHFDPVNLITSPERYYNNAGVIREFCEKLGPHIKSCHAKDIVLRHELTVHLYETRPGLGNFDFEVYLREINELDRDMPLMIEHLEGEDEYAEAAAYIRSIAEAEGIEL